MKQEKIRRLEKHGWRVGDTSEFLGLSKEESQYIELKIMLSENLRIRREKLGYTQTDLAKMLRSSQSRIAKMEAANSNVSIDLIVKSLFKLGVSNKEISEMISQ
jgi:ribosome-binding protein aMBF1 (putative translation factor)